LIFSHHTAQVSTKPLLKPVSQHVNVGSVSAYDNLDAPEDGLPFDDGTKERLHKLKAERENLLIEISAIRRNQSMPTTNINQSQIEAFCRALKIRLLDKKSGFGKGYLRLLVDEIKIDSKQAIMQGSYENMAYAVGTSKETSEEVPIFIRKWRPGDDLNVRPAP